MKYLTLILLLLGLTLSAKQAASLLAVMGTNRALLIATLRLCDTIRLAARCRRCLSLLLDEIPRNSHLMKSRFATQVRLVGFRLLPADVQLEQRTGLIEKRKTSVR